MAVFLDITHDQGGTVGAYWATVTDPGAYMSLTAAAAQGGTVWGLQAVMGTIDARTVAEPVAAPGSNEFRMRWRFDTNSCVVPAGTGNGDVIKVEIDSSYIQAYVSMRFRYNNAGEYRFQVFMFQDDSIVQISIVDMALTDEPHCVECRCVQETFDGANDGQLQIFLDGVSVGSSGGQNFLSFQNIHTLDCIMSAAVAVTGIVYVDEFEFNDNDEAEMYCAFYPDFIPASVVSRPVDIDADGTFIYLAARSGAVGSVLIKFSTTLTEDGSLVFSPGAGAVIGVQCGDPDTDVIWVAGDFGGTDVVAKSNDAGATFEIKATGGAIDTVYAFTVGPNDSTRVYVSDGNATYTETLDDGVTWNIRNNTTVIFDASAIARLDVDLEEMVFANEYSAGDLHNIDFSPNSGIQLEDVVTTQIAASAVGLVVG